MVPSMFRGAVVVIFFAFIMFMLAALIQYEKQLDQGAEGPYRKERPGRCVCK